MKTAHPIITAIQTGALAWVEGRDIPLVDSLSLPDSPLGRLTAQAYLDQSVLGWNVLFHGFWVDSWRLAQKVQFRSYRSCNHQDTGEQWSGHAQLWFFDLFELIWGLRNIAKHGADFETQRLIQLIKCEHAVNHLYHQGDALTLVKRHPFRDPIDVLLSKSPADQELWITKMEGYLQRAFHCTRV